jgi:uncharacterized membrane protein
VDAYAVVKTVHVLSSMLLVGTGFGAAVALACADRLGPSLGDRADVAAQAVVARVALRATVCFTAPAGIVQPLSGFALMRLAGWPFTASWLAVSIALYVLAGMCWLPAVVLQARVARTAAADLAAGRALSAAYRADVRAWGRLAVPAFVAMAAIVVLMVAKPALW